MFNKDYKLLEPLSEEETLKLILQAQNGELPARNKLIEHNLKYINFIIKYINSDIYEKDDFVDIGVVGLIKAIKTYLPEKGVKFSTYSKKCILNEIFVFLKKENKHSKTESLNRIISSDGAQTSCLEDLLCCESDFVDEITEEELNKKINDIINNLPFYKKQVIKMYFGFNDDQLYSQKEIGEKLFLSQPTVSRIIGSTILEISEQLQYCKLIEITPKQRVKLLVKAKRYR